MGATIEKKSANKTKDWIKFLVVMIVFMAGMIVLTINGVHNPWFWLLYAAVWWYTEAVIAKNIHLHWSVWVVIIGLLTVLDLWLIQLLSNS
ncbi:hypothetical protein [Psychroserpens sp.]|uniref:hypothetical protein n=1 Tax=Psychroserpens sp. TaxID=2020870 RepID=UPI001B2E54CC|nr:hypothetical protein [Psychroserpens sp.]MBO6606711.1 hypothetical protein [Psychroserpens sp.]MBO6631904.1 hypothetical protein [Psychroserpens sp.]MBO6653415.1 hypothetical protein [Psychroserpens sp.]MBO6680558.1 hypothetical protein [Psychroserpens sp.]MBO6750484.1 hypothetical protein [Psychroserpens sp.]